VAGARGLAHEIRVGLESSETVTAVAEQISKKRDPLLELSFGKPVRQHVKEFGLLFAAIGTSIAAVKLYRGREVTEWVTWLAPAMLFAVLGLYAPRVLLPVWRAWMKLAHYLSLVMTSVVLSIAWCVGLLPIAGVMKIFGVKPMDLSYGANRTSYWETRNPKYDDFKRLELQW
jgi:Saxitoxin biosynthesis operon protein SxtJ